MIKFLITAMFNIQLAKFLKIWQLDLTSQYKPTPVHQWSGNRFSLSLLWDVSKPIGPNSTSSHCNQEKTQPLAEASGKETKTERERAWVLDAITQFVIKRCPETTPLLIFCSWQNNLCLTVQASLYHGFIFVTKTIPTNRICFCFCFLGNNRFMKDIISN